MTLDSYRNLSLRIQSGPIKNMSNSQILNTKMKFNPEEFVDNIKRVYISITDSILTMLIEADLFLRTVFMLFMQCNVAFNSEKISDCCAVLIFGNNINIFEITSLI